MGDTSLINACEDSRGRVTLVSAGTNCNANESQVTWLKDVDAGAGLSISRSSSGATISLDSSSSSSPSAYEVLATDGQTTTSTTFSNMTNGTQSVTLTTKSIIYVNAHTNAFTTGGGQIAYIRTVYNDGSDHEIGTQGYTNATADGQSITAGGVVTLDPGTYTFAIQKKLYVNGGTSTFYQPSMAIMVVPIQ